MLRFHVAKMSCGGCAASVTKAIQGIDATAGVDVDLTAKLVTVRSAADPDRIGAAITAAGYPAEQLPLARPA